MLKFNLDIFLKHGLYKMFFQKNIDQLTTFDWYFSMDT